MQPLDCNAVQGSVVQHHNSISIQGEALEGEQGVVWLHHHVTGLVLVGEDTASGHSMPQNLCGSGTQGCVRSAEEKQFPLGYIQGA